MKKRNILFLTLSIFLISACGAQWVPEEWRTNFTLPPTPEAVSSAQVIQAQNADSLQEVYQLGQGAPDKVFFAPDNETVVGAGALGIYVYEGGDLSQEPLILREHTDKVTDIKFLNEETMISSGADGRLIFWNTGDWSVDSEWDIGRMIDGFDIHPDGTKLVTASRIASIIVETWDIESGEEILELDTIATNSPVRKILYSLDGAQVALTYGDAYAYDAETGEQLMRTTVNSNDLAFNSDQPELVLANREGFTVYDTESWERTISSSATQIFDGATIRSMLMHPSGSRAIFLLSGSAASMKNVVAPFVADTWSVTSITNFMAPYVHGSFSPNGREYVTVHEDGTIRRWDRGFDEIDSTENDEAPSEVATSFFSPDGTEITAITTTGDMITLDATSLEVTNQTERDGAGTPGSKVAVNADGTLYVAQDFLTTQIGSTESGEVLQRVEDETLNIQRDSYVYMDIERNGNSTFTTSISYPDPITAQFTPDGQNVILSTFGGLAFMDIETGEVSSPVWVRGEDTDNLLDVSFTPDGQYLVGSTHPGADFRVWELEKLLSREELKPEFLSKEVTGNFLKHVVSNQFLVAAVRGKVASYADSTMILLWDLISQDEIASIPVSAEESERVIQLAFNADGSLLAVGDDTGEVKLIETGEGAVVHSFQAHAGILNSIVFSPDGMTLATSGADGTFKLWRIPDA